MENIINISIPIVIFAVFVVLCFGLYTLFKGGDVARSYSNKLMRLRIVLQFVAVMLMMAGLWLAS
jgi:hypothetical protein